MVVGRTGDRRASIDWLRAGAGAGPPPLPVIRARAVEFDGGAGPVHVGDRFLRGKQGPVRVALDGRTLEVLVPQLKSHPDIA